MALLLVVAQCEHKKPAPASRSAAATKGSRTIETIKRLEEQQDRQEGEMLATTATAADREEMGEQESRGYG